MVAGLSVAVLLVPQALAYARLAGMPPYVGLYAAALPPLAAAFFASSPYLHTGPVAITALLTYGALAEMAPPGSAEYVQLGALLAFAVGATRVAIGLMKAGDIAFLMSEPVLRGFTTAAALLIVVSQLPAMLGVQAAAPSEGVVVPAIQALRDPSSWDPLALALAGLVLLVVLGGRRLHALVPGVPIAAAMGIAATVFLGYDGATLGSVPEGLPPLSLRLPWLELPGVILAGIVIALVGFAEAGSIARVFSAREKQHWSPDRDFVSQGVANLASAVSGGFPVGGSFARSSLSHLLGARTRWNGAVTGLAVLAFLPFASILAPLPEAVLAAIVVAAVLKLLRFREIFILWGLSRPQFAVAAVTFTLTVALAPRIDQAVLLGILFAIVVHLWREFRVELDSWTEGDTLHIRPDGVVWFGSAEALRGAAIDLIAEHGHVVEVVFHMERLGRVDLTAALTLERVIRDARDTGLEVRVTSVHPHTARVLEAILEELDAEPPAG